MMKGVGSFCMGTCFLWGERERVEPGCPLSPGRSFHGAGTALQGGPARFHSGQSQAVLSIQPHPRPDLWPGQSRSLEDLISLLLLQDSTGPGPAAVAPAAGVVSRGGQAVAPH